jgi:Flp pilus assembly protein TadD
MPKSAAVMDTLGWIYYLKGSYLNAVAELQESAALEPDNAVINYHLGMAYYKNGQTKDARNSLEKALKIQEKFKGADEARKILEDIRAKG